MRVLERWLIVLAIVMLFQWTRMEAPAYKMYVGGKLVYTMPIKAGTVIVESKWRNVYATTYGPVCFRPYLTYITNRF